MIAVDEDALICDLAETYQIFDYKQLPATLVAVFSCGLRENARIKMRMNNQKVPMEILLLAGMNDRLSLLLWAKTKDGQKGKNRPKSLLEAFGQSSKQEKEEILFNSGKEFEEARAQLIQEMTIGKTGGDN